MTPLEGHRIVESEEILEATDVYLTSSGYQELVLDSFVGRPAKVVGPCYMQAYIYCRPIIEKKENTCSCPISQLMVGGCVCEGI